MYNTEKIKKNKLQISVTFSWNEGKCFLLVVYVGLALYASYIKWYGANLHNTVHDILEISKIMQAKANWHQKLVLWISLAESLQMFAYVAFLDIWT